MRLIREIRDWLRKAENAKTDYRWLILTFFATWWFWSFPVQAENRSYGRTALIEIAPPSDFLPTTALLDNGALECQSADAFAAVIQSNNLWMSEIFSTNRMTVERMRLETALNCRTRSVSEK
jgi:hypothetical protein